MTGPAETVLGQLSDVADKGGMKAVIATPYWTIERNARNRARLLATDPKEFSRIIRRWTDAHKQSDIALEMSEGDLRRYATLGVPTRIIAGCDEAHSRDTSERIAALVPAAEFVDPPGFYAAWNTRKSASSTQIDRHEERRVQSYYDMPGLSQLIDDFITKTEAQC